MTTVVPGGRIRTARRLAAPIAAVGGAVGVLSMLFMPWFDLRGPWAFRVDRTGTIRSGTGLGLFAPNPGHTAIAWVLVALAILAGLLALTLRTTAQLIARTLTVVLSVVLLAGLALSHSVTDVRSTGELWGDGDRVAVLPGFWVAVAGFVLFGLGVLVAPTRGDRPRVRNDAVVSTLD